MPRFEPDFTKVHANIKIFERGEYLVRVGKPKPFAYEKQDEKNSRRTTLVYGVTYPLIMVGKLDEDGALTDEFRGDTVTPMRSYLHSEGALPMTKRFIMACAGFDRDDEERFNEEFVPDYDASFEVDDDVLEGEEMELTVGDFWTYPEGHLVIVSLDKRMYKNPKDPESKPTEQQDFKAWTPAKDLESLAPQVGGEEETTDEDAPATPAASGRGRRGR